MNHTENYTMLCDFYELTMGNGYFQTGLDKRICLRFLGEYVPMPSPRAHRGWFHRSSRY